MKSNMLLVALACLAVGGALLPGCSCTRNPAARVTSPRSDQEANPNSTQGTQDQGQFDNVSQPTASPSGQRQTDEAGGSDVPPPSAQAGSSAESVPSSSSQKPNSSARGPALSASSDSTAGEAAAPSASPAEGLRQSEKLFEQAMQLQRSGDAQEAFAKALRAWQIVSDHPGDAACNQLRSEIEPILADLGQAANDSAGRTGPIRRLGKPTAIK